MPYGRTKSPFIYENDIRRTYKLCGQNESLFKVTTGGPYSYHRALECRGDDSQIIGSPSLIKPFISVSRRHRIVICVRVITIIIVITEIPMAMYMRMSNKGR
jgi:hypothetical protein